MPRDAPLGQTSLIPDVKPRVKPFQLTEDRALEHALQIDCTKMLGRVLRPDVTWTAIDHAHSINMKPGRNGKPIGLIEAVKRKKRGLQAGIPDYLFWDDGRGFAIEMKKDVDSVLSKDQKVFLNRLITARIPVSICWDIWQVFRKVQDWGLVRPGVRVMT